MEKARKAVDRADGLRLAKVTRSGPCSQFAGRASVRSLEDPLLSLQWPWM